MGERLALARDGFLAFALVERLADFFEVFFVAFLLIAISVAPQLQVPRFACVFPLGTVTGEAASSYTSTTRIHRELQVEFNVVRFMFADAPLVERCDDRQSVRSSASTGSWPIGPACSVYSLCSIPPRSRIEATID